MSLALAGLRVNLRVAVLAVDVRRISDQPGDPDIVQLDFDDLIVGLASKGEDDVNTMKLTKGKRQKTKLTQLMQVDFCISHCFSQHAPSCFCALDCLNANEQAETVAQQEMNFSNPSVLLRKAPVCN